MSVELPLRDKYLKVSSGKTRTRVAGGGNSAKKHPNRNQGMGGRAEAELKKAAMAQTAANRKVLVLHGKRKRLLPLSLYRELQDTGKLRAYLDA